MIQPFVVTVAMVSCFYGIVICDSDLKEIDTFLSEYNRKGDALYHNESIATWSYETDMTDEHKKETMKWAAISANFSMTSSKVVRSLLKEVDVNDVPRSQLRQLNLIKRTASSTSESVNKEVSDLVSEMTSIYSDTKMTKEGDSKSYSLDYDLLPIMSNVTKKNMKNLRWAFSALREEVGKQVKPLYKRYVKLVNQGANENDYMDYGEYWREEYEESNLEDTIEGILEEMNPLYKKLHAYTRYKLNENFGDDVVDSNGMIPIHLLNMWGQNWRHLYDLLVPYPNTTTPDVTEAMKNKMWQNIDLLKVAESFFVSLGLDKMPQSFFDNSLIERKPGTKPVCFPSSFDLGKGDVRIKMPCMQVSQSDLITVHHEMGHIQYYLLYKDLPLEFRTAAHDGFHEAVGDAISLSVMTSKHLKSLDLLKESYGSEGEDLNFLMKQALEHVAFVPFAYIVDKWRWSVFAGNTKPEWYNKYWWDLRHDYQGVAIPKGMKREDEDLCDICTFFHVPHDTEYLRYFLSAILQFQFHKAMCDEAGVDPPYHKCSIHKSKQAGEKLRDMLQLGRKLPWTDALKVLTGTKAMSGKPLRDYFQPLEEWLDKHRKKHSYKLGWEDDREGSLKLFKRENGGKTVGNKQRKVHIV